MLATAIIVFREVLEAALIVGIVMAASRGAARRGLWVAGGIADGVCLGRLLVAVFAGGDRRDAAQGMGQELFDAAILFAAVGMLGWHNVWMSRHGRELAGNATRLGKDVRSGARPLWALAFAVALGGVARGVGDGAVSLRHCLGRPRRGASHADGRRHRVGAGGRRRYGDLLGPRQHPDAAAVQGDQLAGAAARRRACLAGRRLPDAGRLAAAARQQSVGHLVPAERIRAWPGASCTR